MQDKLQMFRFVSWLIKLVDSQFLGDESKSDLIKSEDSTLGNIRNIQRHVLPLGCICNARM